MSASQTIHATTVSLNGTGVLLRGAPGSGKSTLALQLIESTGTGLGQTALVGQLVSDDQTILTLHEGVPRASAPKNLEGLLELRGWGLLRLRTVQDVALRLVVDLRPASEIERLPELENLRTVILGIALPRIAIDAAHPSAAARVRTALVGVLAAAFPL